MPTGFDDEVGQDIQRLIRFSDTRRSIELLALDESEHVEEVAEAWAFTYRLFDPGFFRHVWGGILRDPDIPGRLATILTIILKEWKGGGAVRQADLEAALERPTSGLPALAPDSVRRIIRRDLSHVTDKETDSEDSRRRRIATIIDEARSGQLPAAPGLRFVPMPMPDPAAMAMAYDRLHILPEMIEWTNAFNRQWNAAAGRKATPALPTDPEEDRLHETVSFWLTTREIPALWFLAHSRKNRVELLRRTYPFSYTKGDFARLNAACEEGGISDTERAKLFYKGAWALSDSKHPREALIVALGGLELGLKPSEWLGNLHQIASVAYHDLREAPLESIRHARAYAEHRAKGGDTDGQVTGLLCEAIARYALMAPRAHPPADRVVAEMRALLATMPSAKRWWTAAQVAIGLGGIGRTRQAVEFLDIASEAASALDTEDFAHANRFIIYHAQPIAVGEQKAWSGSRD